MVRVRWRFPRDDSRSMSIKTIQNVGRNSSTFRLGHSLDTLGSIGLPRDLRVSSWLAPVRFRAAPHWSPGSYKVVLLNDSSTREVGFYRNGELIGQAPVKLVDQGKKFRETEVDANILDDHSELMTEMRLSGWTERVVFSESDASSASGQ